MADANAIDQILNDASDQAMAWYSILADKPVTVPSALIAAQDNMAATIGQPNPNLVTVTTSPYLMWIAIAAGAALLIYVLRGK